MATIKFPACERHNLGRSGYIKACGLEITKSSHGEEVYLEPISSKGSVSPARLVVPVSHLKELRDALDAILTGQIGQSR